MIYKTLPLAVLSDDRRYRYMLARQWDNTKPYVAFVGLNPSTADENVNDNTINVCIGYAKRWGFGGIIMVNLFAFRATEPKDMRKAEDPIGCDNDRYLKDLVKNTDTVLAVWGNHGKHKNRSAIVGKIFDEMDAAGYIKFYYLKLNKNGEPCHPLYKSADLQPTRFTTAHFRHL